jgi:hypothetical protein
LFFGGVVSWFVFIGLGVHLPWKFGTNDTLITKMRQMSSQTRTRLKSSSASCSTRYERE